MKKQYVEQVYENSQCSSCGICVGVCNNGAITYKYDKYGFLQPQIDNAKCVKCNQCISHCPGVRFFKKDLKYDFTNTDIYYGHSNDEQLRESASAGGVVSEFLKYLLQYKKVDYCVVVGNDASGTPRSFVSNNIDEIINAKTSKYCPVEYGRFITQIDPSKNRYAIVGLPCQIAALRSRYKKYEDNIIFIALICNHMPGRNWTRVLTECFPENETERVTYRGKGWPGKITLHGKKDIELPYRQTFRLYGKYYYSWRCKICNDHMGSFSDVAVGDAYFVRKNEAGNSMCIVYNTEISRLFDDMCDKGLADMHILKDTYKFFDAVKTLLKRSKKVPVMLEAGKKIGYVSPKGLDDNECLQTDNKEIKSIIIDQIKNKNISKNGLIFRKTINDMKQKTRQSARNEE